MNLHSSVLTFPCKKYLFKGKFLKKTHNKKYKRLTNSKNLKKKSTNPIYRDKKTSTSAIYLFVKIRQSVQPISVIPLQTGLTFHSHKIGNGLFGLLVIVAVERSYVCQSTNPIDVYSITAVPDCCIISASDAPL